MVSLARASLRYEAKRFLPAALAVAFSGLLMLVQLGLLDAATLPVAGVESAQKVVDPNAVPSNELIKRNK